ncbi:AAA family ATPase [Parafrankia elaeagni]|uniref:AAA family ATPase n=1 Tax=Parafrankia elaeagni TaxID=222534 RepID=UPI000477D960
MSRPVGMFDREFEWEALGRFALDAGMGATLGVVSGRRRQGKTFLLRALCEATGGFYFGADEATDGESLRRVGAVLADRLGAPAPLAFDDWYPAFDALLELGRDRPVPVVIDEFPYLVRANPRLPSIVQNVLAPRRAQRDASRARLLLCGSAMSFMGGLLAGSAPLRGRAGLELVVPTLGHQLAARFWGIDDPVTALKVNAIVGGTPAYRREFARDDVPSGPDDFDAWVTRTVLSPTSALFREGRYLLSDEPDLRDTALYHSVLAAIAEGNATRGGIASYLGRKSGDLAHPLTVLADCGLIMREPDAFRDNRTQFRIAEPLVTFYHAVMRPMWSDLEHARDSRRLAQLWRIGQRRFVGNVLGPHFEHVCRYWTAHQVVPERIGAALVSRVTSGVVNDPSARASHQLDVVAFGFDDDDQGQERLLAIGEAKWGETMGLAHLDRLRRIRELLSAQGRPGAATARLACFSAAGFGEQLQAAAAQSPDVLLVGPSDLYADG